MQQAPPLVAVWVCGLARNMRRRARLLSKAAEHIAVIREVTIFSVVIHVMMRCFELSVPVTSPVLRMTEKEEFFFNYLHDIAIRCSSQGAVVRNNLDHLENSAVTGVIDYRRAVESKK